MPCETHGVESVECTRYLAEQGQAKAQYHLGIIYYGGLDVWQDKQEAGRWFRMAAKQGHVSSQIRLGDMYYNC